MTAPFPSPISPRTVSDIIEKRRLTVTGYGDSVASMVGKTARERMAAQRERRKEQGLQRVEFWVPARFVARIKAYVAKLLKGE